MINKEPLSARPFVGLGVQADCYIYDDVNRQFGVSEKDYALLEKRLKMLKPGIARIFLPTTDFNFTGDGKTYDWDSIEMQRQIRNLTVLKAAGARVNVCMGPWTNKQMQEPNSESMAVDLIVHLVKERGFENIRWLSLFNEPDSIYGPDTKLERQLTADGMGAPLPWKDYIAKHQRAADLLENVGLADSVKLLVADTVWPPQRRLERLTLSSKDFQGRSVGYGFHHYAPDYPNYFTQADSAKWEPPPLAEETMAYRKAVGADAELICWEFNVAGFGMHSAWAGTGPKGEDHMGTFRTAVAHTRRVLDMLANGVDGISHWCVGDMFYRSGLEHGVMYMGLWRYKWEGWVPRPYYFYYAALMHAFRPGCYLHKLTELPNGVVGLAAQSENTITLVLLNFSGDVVNIKPSLSGSFERIRISPERLPQRPDVSPHARGDEDQPFSVWEQIKKESGEMTLSMDIEELTLIRCTKLK